jgi:Tol biopolymer transport system component
MRSRSLQQLLTLLIVVLPLFSANAQPLMRSVSDVSVLHTSGLSGLIAFTLAKNSQSSIRYIDLDNARVLEFPTPLRNVSFPTFSHDGDSVAYEGVTSKGVEIFVSRWNGDALRRVTFNTKEDGNPSFAPDDTSIFHYTETLPYDSEIYQTTLESPFTSKQKTKFGSANTVPRQSPDLATLLYSTDRYRPSWNVCFMNLATGADVCPFRTERGSNCRAQWSPDGTQVSLSIEHGNTVDIYLYNPTTGVSRKVTDLPHKEYDSAWSPDGAYIAFAHDPTGEHKYDLKVVSVSTGEVTAVAKSQGSLRYLSWAPAREYTVAASGDLCPDDSKKTNPGACGCGNLDTDTDEDTVPDCIDECPQDDLKIHPGVCGCGSKDISVGGKVCPQQSPPPTVRVKTVHGEKRVVISAPAGFDSYTFYVEQSGATQTKTLSTRLWSYTPKTSDPVRASWKPKGGAQSRWSGWMKL